MADHHLKFIGQPGQFIAGIPAGDITVSTKAEADELVKGGLYEEAKEPPKAPAIEEA